MTDMDGRVSYSPIEVVNNSNYQADITIYPNPSNGFVNIRIDAPLENGRLLLINAVGQEVSEMPLTAGISSFDFTALPHGMYSYFVFDGQHRVHQGKLILR